jgi:hypothetical protein
VADRRSVFADDSIVTLARERFVCAADEVWRLQRGSDEDCVFFQRAVNGGERILDRGTRQGTWVFAPDGTLLGHVNTRNVEAQRKVLETALERWKELPDVARRVPADARLDPGHRWEDSTPVDGLVLERIARELVPEGQPRGLWNRDFVWMARAEIEQAVPADLAPGSVFELGLLATRLARFHLVDNARGQTQPYAAEEVEGAALRATATARVGSAIVLRLEGQSAAACDGTWKLGPDTIWEPTTVHPHGIETRMHGRAVFDREQRRFTQFELVAVGRRWGFTQNNGRWRAPEPGLLAFHLGLAPEAPRVAPTFVDVYDADWIERPEIGMWRDSPEECGLER